MFYEPGSGSPTPPAPVSGCANALISDFLPSESLRNKCSLFKPPGLWYLRTARTDQEISKYQHCVDGEFMRIKLKNSFPNAA